VETCTSHLCHWWREVLNAHGLDVGDITATTLGVDVRPWLVDLTDINGAGIGLAIVGGLLAFIVMYFDQNITVRLVNAREHKLKKVRACRPCLHTGFL
jgi:hypothetical protein